MAEMTDLHSEVRQRAYRLPVPSGPVVYFIGTPTGRHIKIGFTKDIRGRLAGLQTGNPSPLDLWAYECAGLDREKELHHRFRRSRGNGEWFLIKTPILRHIEGLQLAIAEAHGIDPTVEDWPDDCI